MATKQVVPGEQDITMAIRLRGKTEVYHLAYEVAFLGAQFGVALAHRGAGQHHDYVVLYFLSEDDGKWQVTQNAGPVASFWIDDLAEQLAAARAWLDLNAMKAEHGWTFK